MREAQSFGNLRGNVQYGLGVQGLSGFDPVGQTAFFKIRHDEVGTFRTIRNFLHRHHVRVPQPFQVPRLLEKTVNDILICHQVGFDQFDCHIPSGARIARQQNNAHSPAAEHTQNFKLIQNGQQTRT